ncbi:MAG: hypothetical protein ACYTGX_06020 [Planctomycetota bacterium]|jgi:hypothetical protein
MDPAKRMAGRVKTFGAVVLIWSILAAVMSVLVGLNTVVSVMMQGMQAPGPGMPPAAVKSYYMVQYATWGILGLGLLWTFILALLGLRIGPALARLDDVRRWALIWCAANLIVCPFGTGIGIWGLILLTRPEAAAVLEGGVEGPAGVAV